MVTDSPRRSRRSRKQLDACVVAAAEQIHHLELRWRRRAAVTPHHPAPALAGWYSAGCGECPVSVEVIASSSTSSPRPPASTTPALASTSSCRGRLRPGRRRPPRPPIRRPRPGPRRRPRRPRRRPAAACSTETMVPGTVSPTDATTRPTACRSAAPNTAPSTSVKSPSALVGRLGGDVGEAAQDLRQDDPGVAAGPAATRPRPARRRPPPRRSSAGAESAPSARRAHGEQHVRAGVGVGHGEDVESIDLVGVRR